MELKDVILSTLAEMEESAVFQTSAHETPSASSQGENQSEGHLQRDEPTDETMDDEMQFLQNIRERILVLFEGFQSPNNTQIEAKVDLTLNFLEYLLSTFETRIDNITKKERP